jgi:hypothetical protein
MEEHPYDTSTWSTHELHPKSKSIKTVEWIFLIDLLNFSFFSDETDPERKYFVMYKGEKYTGYWSLCAAVNRALAAGIPITSPRFWVEADDGALRDIFSGDGIEEMPMLYGHTEKCVDIVSDERIACLREAGQILCEVLIFARQC